MDVSSFVLLSHEQALRRQLDVAANNMANTNTVGFKREQALFHEYVEKTNAAPIDDAKRTSFVLDYGAVHDSRPGSFQPTGNPLDIMIDGPGYLSIQGADGTTGYTRAGFVKVLDTGDLAVSGGQLLLGEDGRKINVPREELASLAIASDGTVSTRTGPIGRIGVFQFDELRVSARGDGVMTGAGGTLLPATATRLKTGGVEASNVEPIVETTSMVEILRSYQSSMEMSSSINAMRSSAISRLSKINN
ncbi:flagellar hook-basal body complex protein [Sphingomonas sp. AP4-R1]|uniref:flagellar hook-basal body complex protein n=1 Tax=Sphingomonas sp. AP4-R1 TaxID=2735134 RepID=UPI0014935CBB|nr:flagellar hook-basal body complex protein [Sphingomonas sp. AP4-R1]QJU57444.1 flagellar hook-basal body complex protein [Sphingomonas sp. AP4-R1]